MSKSFLLTTNSPSCFALSKCSSWMPTGLSFPAWHSPKFVWITLFLHPMYLHYDSKGNLRPLTIVCLSSVLQGTPIWPWSCSVHQGCLGVELFTGTYWFHSYDYSEIYFSTNPVISKGVFSFFQIAFTRQCWYKSGCPFFP